MDSIILMVTLTGPFKSLGSSTEAVEKICSEYPNYKLCSLRPIFEEDNKKVKELFCYFVRID